jgi:hypothetical protein
MSRSNTLATLVVGGAVALIGWSAPADAQLSTDDPWRYGITPYAWLTGLSGTVGIGPVFSSVDLSAADVLDMLKFGVMATGEARKGPWLIVADGIYARLGAGRTLAIRGDTGSLDLTQRETILQPTAGFTYGDDTNGIDFLAGIRYWNLSSTLDVDRTRRPSNERAMTQQWVDATAGFRVRVAPVSRVRLVAAGDVGGGGSRNSVQAYGSLGYDAWSKWTLGFAYRILDVDYDRNNFLFDTRTQGMIVGATYRTR